jgi:menaquinone-specific isochorismate synthase
MILLPGQHRPERERDDLLALLALCAHKAAELRRPVLLSISLRVRHIDPLAVFLSPKAPGGWRAYFEHPAGDAASAGMDAAWSAVFNNPENPVNPANADVPDNPANPANPSRFRLVRDAAAALLRDAVHAGDIDAPCAGPRFFCAFTFEDTAPHGAPFAAASVFLPRWQAARKDGTYTATANLLISADTPLETTADNVLAARREFGNFECAPPSTQTGTTISHHSHNSHNSHHSHNSQHPPPPDAPTAPPAFPTELGAHWFAAGVSNALSRIAAGELQKVVLARAWRAALPPDFAVGPLLERLRERYPACHTFSFSNATGAAFLGATPERLLEVAAGQLRTEALAGTAPRGTHAAEDARLAAALLGSDKEHREHAAVVDAILANLRAAGVSARADGPPRLVPLAGVQHLRTPVSAALPAGTHILDLAAALHPTPALGGVPRDAALAHIRANEPAPRGLYAGPLGWFDAAGEGALFAAIRSALLDGHGNLEFRAGAGIVAGASPAAELAETDNKSRAIREAVFG